jgi:tyrosyl-tRNA synthetase
VAFIQTTRPEVLQLSGLPTLPYAGEWPVNVVTFLAATGSLSSKGEAKKMIQGGGVSINEKKVTDIQAMISDADLLNQQYILVRKGKKHLDLIVRSS